jgi:hypothetical protein
MAATSISAVDRPLKERFWMYRDRVLHQRRSAAALDDIYWQNKNPQVPRPTSAQSVPGKIKGRP